MLQVRFADERAIGVASLAVHDGNEISTTIDVARRGKRCLHEGSGDDYRKRPGEFHGTDTLVLAATNGGYVTGWIQSCALKGVASVVQVPLSNDTRPVTGAD